MKTETEIEQALLDDLKKEIRRGLEQLDAGLSLPLDAAEIKAKVRRLGKAQAMSPDELPYPVYPQP